MCTRWRSPPESSVNSRCSKPARPTVRSVLAAIAKARGSAGAKPGTVAPSSTTSSTVKGKRQRGRLRNHRAAARELSRHYAL